MRTGPLAGIDIPGAVFYRSGMTDAEIKEDRLIRRMLIAVPVFAVLGFLATAALVAAMVSANFNVMNWLE
jgi:hypothetical protein